MKPPRDILFGEEVNLPGGFSFNRDVARVFDDMVTRSVPLYAEVQRLSAEICWSRRKKGKIYDLGSSTGTTLLAIHSRFNTEPFDYSGIDNSADMNERLKEKLPPLASKQTAVFIQDDITHVTFENPGVILANYTLQFLSPEQRPTLVRKIYDSLPKGGAFFLSEKVLEESEELSNLFIDLYHDFKKHNGYSEMEIARKRDALENVLIPLKVNDYMKMLSEAGFAEVSIILKWCNFCSFLAIK